MSANEFTSLVAAAHRNWKYDRFLLNNKKCSLLARDLHYKRKFPDHAPS